METDGEGKFVSFKVVLGGISLFKMSHGPAGLDCLVCRFIGALEQLRDSSSWIQGHASEEKSLEKFFFFFLCVIAFVGKTLTVTEKKEPEVLPSLYHSLTHVCSLCR